MYHMNDDGFIVTLSGLKHKECRQIVFYVQKNLSYLNGCADVSFFPEVLCVCSVLEVCMLFL